MAARFFINGGVDNLWTTIGNWSTTSGGAGGSAVPTVSDDVTFDGNSPSCTVNGTVLKQALSLTFTNYVNTFTLNQHMTVNGNITLGASMTFAGNAVIRLNGNLTITSNGKAFPHLQTLNTPRTITLADPCVVNGVWGHASGNNHVITWNGSTLTVNGFISIQPGTAASVFTAISGTTVINYTGPSGFSGMHGTISNTLNIKGSTRGY